MAIRQSRGITLGKGTPQRLEGQNGDITIRSSRKGLKLYVKESNKWHSVDLDIDLRQIASTVRRLEDEVKKLSTKTNNTPDVIDRNQMVGQLFLQPTRTAEFIVLDFTVQPSGATFPE